MRNLISLVECSPADLAAMVKHAARYGSADSFEQTLRGRAVGIYFSKTSTRTRTSFWAGATRLGADVITFGPGELQISTGESLEDTGRVLGEYLDVLVVRTNGDVGEIRKLGAQGKLAVINALSQDEHPTQAIADLTTLTEEFGDLGGRHLLYVGEGNSTAAALAFGAALTPGFRLSLVSPPGYGLTADLLSMTEKLAAGERRVRQYQNFTDVRLSVDGIYTSRWQTMGVPKANPNWLRDFHGYSVGAALMRRFSEPHTIFLHDLPAIRGQEVDDAVLDGAQSRAWRQAYHKMTAAMAALEWCLA
jgi:ornithine carbamoyltransferase